jgi:tetratricopeptide (TPR) repeat protein
VQGSQGSLAAIYNTRAALETECNMFQQAYDDFKAQIDCIERAIETGELKRPCLTEVFALGGVGNGFQGLNNYTKAEEYYRRAIDAYSKFPQEKLLLTELSVAPTNLATCLWLQGKLDEAETLLKSIIKDRDDTRNYRYIIINFELQLLLTLRRTGHAMFALGNVEISQGQLLISNGHRIEGAAKLESAFQTHVKTLHLFTTTLGQKHHKVGDAAHKLACHLDRKREYSKAMYAIVTFLSPPPSPRLKATE